MLTTIPPIFLLPALTSALALSEPFKPPDTNNHQHILSLNNQKSPLPHIPSFISLGDSYSAGIGTRPDLTSPSPPCRQGLGAYPYLLATSLLPSHTSHQWLSCTGATTLDLLSSLPPSPSTSQIDAFNTTPLVPTLATLSIAGNDLDFFSLLNACIFRFYGPFTPSTCNDTLQKVSDTLLSPKENAKLKLRIKLILLEILDKIPWEHHPTFFITVTGYARFFNENTTDCDDVSFGVWTSTSPSSSQAAAAKLTQDTRRKMNDFVLQANELISAVIDEVNASFSSAQPKVIFVDYDSLFDQHRFCEPGVAKEPDYERKETWFFLPGGGDVDQAGRTYSSSLYQPTKQQQEDDDDEEGVGYLDPDRCWEDALERGGDWGEKAVCLMAKAKREDPGLRLAEHYRHRCRGGQERGKAVWKGRMTNTNKPGDSMWLTPTYYGKTFHPRSAGHEAIRDKILQVWEEHGYLKT
ncbi:SGNH hydrolase-type esterase domain-containing protein [Cercophora samala]|uniref:SGNH hydrolase-type esterase domain-containing protein n=1 Tax=Cercophora samala TaxID=330535 RepID=A0AA39ZMF7_9PEZI|nr:SGNH hydrolase-type esterase domain-containing protein [Cercophora samala]